MKIFLLRLIAFWYLQLKHGFTSLSYLQNICISTNQEVQSKFKTYLPIFMTERGVGGSDS
jgi:hypothetical protein